MVGIQPARLRLLLTEILVPLALTAGARSIDSVGTAYTDSHFLNAVALANPWKRPMTLPAR